MALRHNAQVDDALVQVGENRIQSVMKADLILVMERGKIVQKGKHEELVAQDGMYRKIYDLQTRIDEELEMEISQSSASE